jgi:hypothetical protein
METRDNVEPEAERLLEKAEQLIEEAETLIDEVICQTARNRDPLWAPKRDPFPDCRAAMRVALS